MICNGRHGIWMMLKMQNENDVGFNGAYLAAMKVSSETATAVIESYYKKESVNVMLLANKVMHTYKGKVAIRPTLNKGVCTHQTTLSYVHCVETPRACFLGCSVYYVTPDPYLPYCARYTAVSNITISRYSCSRYPVLYITFCAQVSMP